MPKAENNRAETDASIQGFSDGVFWERNSQNANKGAKSRKNEKK